MNNTETPLEREKHKFMFHTILYRAETIKQVLSKDPLIHYSTFGFPPQNAEDLKRLREKKFWHDIMEHVYTETIEWPIINVFRNHWRPPRQAEEDTLLTRER